MTCCEDMTLAERNKALLKALEIKGSEWEEMVANGDMEDDVIGSLRDVIDALKDDIDALKDPSEDDTASAA